VAETVVDDVLVDRGGDGEQIVLESEIRDDLECLA